MIDLADVGGYLRGERERQGMTREALAWVMKISTTTIAGVEGGRRKAIDETLLREFARALSLDTDEVLSRAGLLAADIAEHVAQDMRLVRLLRWCTDSGTNLGVMFYDGDETEIKQ